MFLLSIIPFSIAFNAKYWPDSQSSTKCTLRNRTVSDEENMHFSLEIQVNTKMGSVRYVHEFDEQILSLDKNFILFIGC